MLVLQTESKYVDNNYLEWCANTINLLYSIQEPVFAVFVEDPLKNETGRIVDGAYVKFNTEGTSVCIMFINDNSDEMRMLNSIIHEYAHHLSQQGHDEKLFRLYYEFLIKEGLFVMVPEEKIKEKIGMYVERLKKFLNAETANLFQPHLVELDRDIAALSLLYEVLEEQPPLEVVEILSQLKVKCQKL